MARPPSRRIRRLAIEGESKSLIKAADDKSKRLCLLEELQASTAKS